MSRGGREDDRAVESLTSTPPPADAASDRAPVHAEGGTTRDVQARVGVAGDTPRARLDEPSEVGTDPRPESGQVALSLDSLEGRGESRQRYVAVSQEGPLDAPLERSGEHPPNRDTLLMDGRATTDRHQAAGSCAGTNLRAAGF